jgi:hypothetical protein
MRKRNREVLMGLGLVACLALAALAVRSGRAWSIESVTPPPAVPAVAALPASPVPIPHERQPAEAIVQEIREACQLIRTPGITVAEVARRLGTITEQDPETSVSFQPKSRYFSDGEVFRLNDDREVPTETPSHVSLTLRDSRQLPMTALVAAFGPGHDALNMDGPEEFNFDLQAKPEGPLLCTITSARDWRVLDGPKEGVIARVGVVRE